MALENKIQPVLSIYYDRSREHLIDETSVDPLAGLRRLRDRYLSFATELEANNFNPKKKSHGSKIMQAAQRYRDMAAAIEKLMMQGVHFVNVQQFSEAAAPVDRGELILSDGDIMSTAP
jgi:hypothetical protein